MQVCEKSYNACT